MERMVVRKEDCGREIKKSESKKGGMGVNRDSDLGCSSGFVASHLSLKKACALITA